MGEQYAGLRAQFLEFRAARKNGRAYPVGLRRRGEAAVVALRAQGATWRDIEEAVGMSLDTARAWWLAREADGVTATAMVPVEVQGPPRPVRDGSMTLVSPGGYQVTGTGLEQLLTLLRALG